MRIPVELELIVLPGLLLLAVVVPVVLSASAVVWGTRALFGLRPGIIAGWIVIVLMPLIPVLLGYQFTEEAAVPLEIVDDKLIDNDGAMRSLAVLTVLAVPAAVASIIAAALSVRSFNRRLKLMASA